MQTFLRAGEFSAGKNASSVWHRWQPTGESRVPSRASRFFPRGKLRLTRVCYATRRSWCTKLKEARCFLRTVFFTTGGEMYRERVGHASQWGEKYGERREREYVELWRIKSAEAGDDGILLASDASRWTVLKRRFKHSADISKFKKQNRRNSFFFRTSTDREKG